jgi:hypothetical protein
MSRSLISGLLLAATALVGCSSSLAPNPGSGGRGGGQASGAGGRGIVGTVGTGGTFGGSGGVGAVDASCQAGDQCPMGACIVAGSCTCGLPLVCFGSDPTVYEKYLNPRDGGYSAGYCPTTSELRKGCGEGSLCFYGCGPLSPAEIGAAQDAGVRAATDAVFDSCCFWLLGIPGV